MSDQDQPITDPQWQQVRDYLCRLADSVTRPSTYGFQVLRRERENGDIEYQIFADTEPDGTQIAWVQSTRHDAEFISACLAQAPLFRELLALRQVRAEGAQAWRGMASVPKAQGEEVIVISSEGNVYKAQRDGEYWFARNVGRVLPAYDLVGWMPLPPAPVKAAAKPDE